MSRPVPVRVRDRTYPSAAELYAALAAGWYWGRRPGRRVVDLRPEWREPGR